MHRIEHEFQQSTKFSVTPDATVYTLVHDDINFGTVWEYEQDKDTIAYVKGKSKPHFPVPAIVCDLAICPDGHMFMVQRIHTSTGY